MLIRLPIRGGNWNNGSNAGLFALNLNNARSNVNSNIGFRPALGECEKLQGHGLSVGAPPKGRLVPGQVPKHEQAESGQ